MQVITLNGQYTSDLSELIQSVYSTKVVCDKVVPSKDTLTDCIRIQASGICKFGNLMAQS